MGVAKISNFSFLTLIHARHKKTRHGSKLMEVETKITSRRPSNSEAQRASERARNCTIIVELEVQLLHPRRAAFRASDVSSAWEFAALNENVGDPKSACGGDFWMEIDGLAAFACVPFKMNPTHNGAFFLSPAKPAFDMKNHLEAFMEVCNSFEKFYWKTFFFNEVPRAEFCHTLTPRGV